MIPPRRFRLLVCEFLETRCLLAGDLIGHWNANSLNATLDDGSTVDSWLDIAGGAAANSSGTPTLIKDALFGRSVVRFDGADGEDRFTVAANDSPMSDAEDFTIAVVFATMDQELSAGPQWYNNTGLVDGTVLRGFASSWGLVLNEQGQIGAGLGNPAITQYSSVGNLNDGLPHVAIYTRAGETISLYVDGGPAESRSDGGSSQRTGTAMTLGAVSRGGPSFSGDLADIRIFDGALSADEVRDLYDSIADKYVSPVYDPAIAVADSYLVDANSPYAVDAENGVLANDMNIDELPLSAQLARDVSDGALTLHSDGSFNYDPGGFTGFATFAYRLNDSVADQNTVDVTLLVDTVPEALEDLYHVNEDTVLNMPAGIGVLANDVDAENDALTASLVSQPSHGTVELEENGAFAYHPDGDYFGDDHFTYQVSDGDQVSPPGVVRILVAAVNDGPQPVRDGFFVTPDTSLTVTAEIGVLHNDTDVDNADLTATATTLPTHGGLTFATDGTFIYVPDTDFTGLDRFAYEASDGELSAGQFVELYVGTPPLEISEFMAANASSLRTRTRLSPDRSFTGDRESFDWLELHNRAATTFSLGGVHLSDDAANLMKWRFPAETSIGGYGHMLVIASGLNIADATLDELGALHTNFRLSDDGEYLSLTDEDGVVLQDFGVGYPPQLPDVSYGVIDGETGYLPPSPGAANTRLFAGVLPAVTFSHKRGFYDEPFAVSLAADGLPAGALAAEIFYTLDGTVPTPATAIAYTEPIYVDRTTTLRASAFQPDYVSAPPRTHTYLFTADIMRQPAAPVGLPESWGPAGQADYEMDARVATETTSPFYDSRVAAGLHSLPTISLVLNRDDFFGATNGIQSFPDRRGILWERVTSVEFIDFAEFDDVQVDAGIRMVGNASRNVNRRKHNMRLAFRDDYGYSQLDLPLFGLGADEAHNNLILRGGNGDSWINPGVHLRAQYIRDQWQRDVQLAMGNLTTHQLYAQLYINGLYWGLYHVFERHDADFLARHLGGNAEDYDAIKDVNGTNRVEPVSGSTQAWEDLMALVNSDLPVAEKYAEVQRQVDVDNMIDYLLINFYHGNNDWDHNNFRTGRRRDDSGRFQFFTWDAERADINSLQLSVNEIGPVDRNVTTFNKAGRPTRIHTELSQHEDYRLRFADRVQQHFFHDGPLSPAGASALWNARAEEIRLALAAESARWGDLHTSDGTPQTVADWQTILDIMNNEFFPVRTDIVLNQLRARGFYPNVEAPAFSQHGGQVPASFQLDMTSPAGTIWFTTDETDPRLNGGAVSLRAKRFAEPVSLLRDTVVKARVLLDGEWSALAVARFDLKKADADSTNLRISEIHFNPGPATPGERAAGIDDPDEFEFIELMNIGDTAIDLSAVELVQVTTAGNTQGVAFRFSAAETSGLEPGERVLVVEDVDAFRLRYGSNLPVAGQWVGGLGNNRELLTLMAGGDIIQQFSYDDAWHANTDGLGRSLEIIDATNPDLAAWANGDSWQASTQAGGTPGVSAVRGDFRGDGTIGGDDIELLHRQVHAAGDSRSFDLNLDGEVDLHDIDAWLVIAGNVHLGDSQRYVFGDANLDGQVDGEDFNAWSERLFTSRNGWNGADFNADGVTDGADFNIWNDNKFANAATAPVDEGNGNALRMPRQALRRLAVRDALFADMTLWVALLASKPSTPGTAGRPTTFHRIWNRESSTETPDITNDDSSLRRHFVPLYRERPHY